MKLNKGILAMSTFEWLPADDIAEFVFVLPEEETTNLNQQECDLETSFAILNLGTFQWIAFLYIILVLLYLLTPKCKCKVKMLSWVRFNGLIRLFISAYLDISLSILLNLYHADW